MLKKVQFLHFIFIPYLMPSRANNRWPAWVRERKVQKVTDYAHTQRAAMCE
jgi:hypothetical protein